MTLDYHAFKSPHAISDRWVVRSGDRPSVKETAAVVEFDGACPWELRKGVIDLRRDCADGRWSGERMLPKVAHQAVPRTLAIRQQDRRDGRYLTGFHPFVFHEEPRGLPWIGSDSRGPVLKDPAIATARLCRICRSDQRPG